MKINDALSGAALVALGATVLWHVQGFPKIPGQNYGAAKDVYRKVPPPPQRERAFTHDTGYARAVLYSVSSWAHARSASRSKIATRHPARRRSS